MTDKHPTTMRLIKWVMNQPLREKYVIGVIGWSAEEWQKGGGGRIWDCNSRSLATNPTPYRLDEILTREDETIKKAFSASGGMAFKRKGRKKKKKKKSRSKL